MSYEPERTYAAMAYDSARDRLVLFGGSGLNDTWEFDGNGWTNVTPANGNPEGRWRHGMAYDASRRRVVMFGGETGPRRGSGRGAIS